MEVPISPLPMGRSGEVKAGGLDRICASIVPGCKRVKNRAGAVNITRIGRLSSMTLDASHAGDFIWTGAMCSSQNVGVLHVSDYAERAGYLGHLRQQVDCSCTSR